MEIIYRKRYTIPQIRVVPILTECLLTTPSTISGGHKRPNINPPIGDAKKNVFDDFDNNYFEENEDEKND